MIIKSFIFISLFLFVIYRFGIIISRIANNENKIYNLLFGFIAFFAVNQLLLTPCIMWHMSFNFAFYLSFTVNIILVIISFFFKKKQKTNFKFNKIDVTLSILVCIIVGFQILFTTISYKSNADDSFYITLSMSSIDSDAIYMEEPSMGKNDEKEHLSSTEKIPSYELQIAIMSKAFDISPTIICHSLLPMMVILVSYIAYYYFAKIFFNEKYSKLFLIIISVIFLFTAFGTRFRTGRLLMNPWQGKAIFLSVALTFVISILIKMDKEVSKENIILLLIANITSIALTSSAIYLLPFVYLPFGILKLFKRKWKDILKLIISFIPVIIYVGILYILARLTTGTVEVPRETVSIKESIESYKSYTYLIYYLIATILILFLGDKKARRYFVYVQVINLLTIWNPMFSNFIAAHFTSSATFWRIFWIMPIELAIAYIIVKIIQRSNNKIIKILIGIISIVILVIPGKFVYSFKFTENLENIPTYIINHANYILEKDKDKEKIMVLAPLEPEHNTMLRLISAKIKLICSRDTYLGKINNEQEIIERRNLSQIYQDIYVYDIETFNELIKKYNIDWIIVNCKDKTLLNYVTKSSMKKYHTIDNYTLFSNY